MAHKNQIDFIRQNKDLIKEPILLVGAKVYDYDQYDLKQELIALGYKDILGTDIEPGKSVDLVLDIIDQSADLLKSRQHYYNTVFCMEVLTNVRDPFVAAEHVTLLLKPDGIIFLSECFIRKMSRMPVDYWRFTWDGLKALFVTFVFFDERSRYAVTRQRDGQLKSFKGKFDEIISDARHPDENILGFLIRRIHRKLFSHGVFRVSRLMPEQSIYAVARLKPHIE